MAVSEPEERRRGVLMVGLEIASDTLAEAMDDYDVIFACEFLFEIVVDHKRQRASEALKKNNPS